MPAGNFSLIKELQIFKKEYQKTKRPSDASFVVFDNLVRRLSRDFGDSITMKRMPQHLFYVAKIIQKILVAEKVSVNETKNGIAAALLHDVGYLIVQNRYQIDREFQKKEVREAHMKAGAQYARKILKTDPFRRWFNARDIKIISDIIAVHDYPSLPKRGGVKGRPLNLNNKLSYFLREADRLWMTSKYGFMYDLQRMEKGAGAQVAQKLFDHISKRYQEEKALYKDDGQFKGGTLFRSPESWIIFLKQKRALDKKYRLNFLSSPRKRGSRKQTNCISLDSRSSRE